MYLSFMMVLDIILGSLQQNYRAEYHYDEINLCRENHSFITFLTVMLALRNVVKRLEACEPSGKIPAP